MDLQKLVSTHFPEIQIRRAGTPCSATISNDNITKVFQEIGEKRLFARARDSIAKPGVKETEILLESTNGQYALAVEFITPQNLYLATIVDTETRLVQARLYEVGIRSDY